jgi:hypothetical protein
MITPELVSYIKSALAKGQTEVEIKQLLVMGGWNETDLKEAFDSLHQPSVSSSSVPPSTAASSAAPRSHAPLLKILGVLLFLGALAYAGWYFFYPKVEVQEENPLPNYSDVEVPDTTPVIVDNTIPLETPLEPTSPIDTIPGETIPTPEIPTPTQPALADYEIKILSPAPNTKFYTGDKVQVKVQVGKYITGIESLYIGLTAESHNFSVIKHENDTFTLEYTIPQIDTSGFLGDTLLAVSGKVNNTAVEQNPPSASEFSKSNTTMHLILDTRREVIDLVMAPDQDSPSLQVKMGGNYVNGKYVPATATVLAVLKNPDGTLSSALIDYSIASFVVADSTIVKAEKMDYAPFPTSPNLTVKVMDIKGVKVGTTKLTVTYKNISKSITVEVIP